MLLRPPREPARVTGPGRQDVASAGSPAVLGIDAIFTSTTLLTQDTLIMLKKEPIPMSSNLTELDRRQLLALLGASSLAVAGCLGDNDDDDTDNGISSDSSRDDTDEELPQEGESEEVIEFARPTRFEGTGRANPNYYNVPTTIPDEFVVKKKSGGLNHTEGYNGEWFLVTDKATYGAGLYNTLGEAGGWTVELEYDAGVYFVDGNFYLLQTAPLTIFEIDGNTGEELRAERIPYETPLGSDVAGYDGEFIYLINEPEDGEVQVGQYDPTEMELISETDILELPHDSRIEYEGGQTGRIYLFDLDVYHDGTIYLVQDGARREQDGSSGDLKVNIFAIDVEEDRVHTSSHNIGSPTRSDIYRLLSGRMFVWDGDNNERYHIDVENDQIVYVRDDISGTPASTNGVPDAIHGGRKFSAESSIEIVGSTKVVCRSLEDGDIIWTAESGPNIEDFILTETHIFLLLDNNRVSVVGIEMGEFKTIQSELPESTHLQQLRGDESLIGVGEDVLVVQQNNGLAWLGW